MCDSSFRWAKPRATAQDNRANQVTTLFIHNLPKKMHWKGLWATFGHHGDVVDAFIPKKRSRKGKRFRFVRYSSREDAERAISRLNDFNLFAYRVSVAVAKFRSRTFYWRKKNRDQVAKVQTKDTEQKT
ncbi:hypothetical protein V6N13_052612 [Hibiscus sabdariffa]